MSFLSFEFAIFVAVLLIAYYTVFKRNQWLLLLCGSLVFYSFASPYYLIFLLLSIVTAHFTAVRMSELNRRITKAKADKNPDYKSIKSNANIVKKRQLVLCLVVNVGILLVLKYTGFFMETTARIVNGLGGHFTVPQINFLLPLGISFYTFMTVSYLLDVYWGVYDAETNILKYALYISYFPHITQGPIDSYADIRGELFDSHGFNLNEFKEGIYRIILGLFKKLVIAGRLAAYVDAVYAQPDEYGSLTLLCATFFYAFQMYCDFSGYMDIAIGVSDMFGIHIAENFNLPYLSKSIPEYWRRWHITLGVWFRTYIFYPVIRSGMCKKISKKISERATASLVTTVIGLACVWLLTGLWHGASWHYVFHGVYHGVIIILSTLLASTYKKIRRTLKISKNSAWFQIFQIVRTFILVDISYILFRASSLSDALYIMKQIFTKMSVSINDITSAVLPFTGDNTAVAYAFVTFIGLIMLIVADLLEYHEIRFVEKHRYFTVAVMMLMILMFGVFGQSSFLYAAY